MLSSLLNVQPNYCHFRLCIHTLPDIWPLCSPSSSFVIDQNTPMAQSLEFSSNSDGNFPYNMYYSHIAAQGKNSRRTSTYYSDRNESCIFTFWIKQRKGVSAGDAVCRNNMSLILWCLSSVWSCLQIQNHLAKVQDSVRKQADIIHVEENRDRPLNPISAKARKRISPILRRQRVDTSLWASSLGFS